MITLILLQKAFIKEDMRVIGVIAHNISIILLLFFQVSNGQIFIEINQSFQNQLLHFRKCHLRIFFTKTEYSNVEETQLYQTILSVSANEMVYSLQNILYNTSNTSNISSSLLIHRRLRCLVHAYLKDHPFVSKSNASNLEIKNSNPQFILFFDNLASTKDDFEDVFQFLKLSNYKLSTALVIFNNSSEVLVICWTCLETLSTTKFHLTHPNLFKGLDIKVNLNYQLLHTDLFHSERIKKFQNCDRSAKFTRSFLPPSVEMCILKSLSKKLNFTYMYNPYKPVPPFFAKIHHQVELSDANFHSRFPADEYQTVEFAFKLEPTTFVVIQHRRDGFNEAIAGMLDWSLWFMLLALYLTMRLSVAVSLAIVKKSENLNLLNIFMNQGLYSHIKPFLRDWKHIRWHLLNKVVWAFTLGTLVNMAYRAKMTSFLTKCTEPSYPKDIRQVNSSGIMTKTIVTYLHGKPNFGRCKENIKYISQIDMAGLRCLTAGFFIHHKNSDEFGNRKAEEYPGTFTVLGPSQYTNMLKDLMKAFVPAKWISSVIKVDTFAIMRPYVVNKNFFYPIFKNCLASLVESGLYEKWEIYYQEMLSWRNFHSTKTAIEDLSGKKVQAEFPVKMNHWHSYLMTNKMYGGSHSEGSAKQAEPRKLSFRDLQVLWMVFGVFLVGLGVTFCIEIFQKHVIGK